MHTFVKNLNNYTLLDANNVSNMMPIFGYLLEDRKKLLEILQEGIASEGEEALRHKRESMRSL